MLMMRLALVRVLAVVVVDVVVVLLEPPLLLRSRVPVGAPHHGRIVRGAICLCICAAGRGDVPFLWTERTTRLHDGPLPPRMPTLPLVPSMLALVLSEAVE